ncbi:putative endonuclease [bacterium A37T11]|nr:putative endonuclease [bacterium A37T11]
MAEHLQTGANGEHAAYLHLVENGFRIVERNWRYKHLEVDLIMMDGNVLVFVEVKTLKGADYGLPFEAVNWQKEQRLDRAANIYIRQKGYEGEIRFDIISIFANGDGAFNIRHIKDAFWPE